MEVVINSLFDKTCIDGLQLKNRLIVAPLTRTSASADGVPTDEMVDYYTSFAQGGFSMIITEGTYTDELFSRTSANQPGIVTLEHQLGWQKVVDSVHKHNTLIVCQLMHGGALSEICGNTIAPSSVRPIGLKSTGPGLSDVFPIPDEMTTGQMNQVKEGFVKAAILASRAGFDGVEIHAANGYLFDQFITEHTNLRIDHYGGSIFNRLKFLIEVFAAIKEALPKDFIIGIRLSESKVNDLTYRWPGGSDTATKIFMILRQVPASYFHVAAEGGKWARECQYSDGSSSTGIAKSLVNIPVIANGGLHDVELAESLISSQQADLISIGRAAIANPNLPELIRTGKPSVPFFKELIKPSLTLKHAKEVMERFRRSQ